MRQYERRNCVAMCVTVCLGEAMTEITLNPEDANAYIVMILAKSFEVKAKKIFGVNPEMRISGYMDDGKARYQILIVLPPRKYLYSAEIQVLMSIGINVVALRARNTAELEVYLELDLDGYLTGIKDTDTLKLQHVVSAKSPIKPTSQTTL